MNLLLQLYKELKGATAGQGLKILIYRHLEKSIMKSWNRQKNDQINLKSRNQLLNHEINLKSWNQHEITKSIQKSEINIQNHVISKSRTLRVAVSDPSSVDMFTAKHAKSFTSNKALFLNRPNNVSTGVPEEYVCVSAIDALFMSDFNTAIR